ncbi:MAG TPA: DUF6152 family protein [Bryobacteraceae bacterium]|nr:DUF6152 family protein [Bryobacteraceae bacterium]
MRSGLGIITLLIAGLAAVPIALLAHHGSAIYDQTKAVTVQGVVTDWLWANPHCLLDFDVKDDKGNTVHWTAEVSNPPDMMNRGWTKRMLKPGDAVTITMIVAKNGEPVGRIARLVVGGKTFEGMGRVPGEGDAKQ